MSTLKFSDTTPAAPGGTTNVLWQYDATTGSVSANYTASGGGGALVLLEQHTASSSAHLDFTSWYSSAYDDYMIEIVGVVNTSSGTLGIRCSTDGGSTYDAGNNYAWQATFADTSGAAGQSNAADSALNFFSSATTPATNLAWYGTLRFMNPLATSLYPMFFGGLTNPYSGASVMHKIDWGGYYASLTPVNAIRFLNSAGNLTSGTIRIYGIAK